MNFTANRKRAAVLSLFSLLVVATPGCVATDHDIGPAGMAVDTGLPGDDAGLAPQPVSLTSTRSILERGTEDVGLEISEGPGINQIAIETSSPDPIYQINRLSEPPRLVIDLPSERVRVSRNISVSDLEYVTGVRVGSHPDKSRIVLDLVANEEVAEDATVTDGKIVVTLRGDDAVAARASMKDGTPGTDAADAHDSSDILSEREILGEDGIVGKDSTVASLPTEVEAIRLEKDANNTSSVVVDLSRTAEYTITKTAPSEYVLTVRDAALSATAKGAALAGDPETAAGIRSVRSTTEGKDTLVRIFAQPETYLTARLNGTQLIVEETRDMAQVSEDIRAQLDPAKEQSEAAAKPEEAKAKVEEKAAASKDSAKDVAKDAAKDSSAKAGDKAAKETVAADASGLSETEVSALLDDSSRYTGRLISLDLQDTDIDNALRIIAEVSNLNIVASDDVTGKVTLRLIDVPWDQALDVILKTNGLDKVLEGNVMRIAPVEKLRQEREALKQAQQAEEELEPLTVKYMRVSYAKASELKTLVETVLSERGSVAYDERSNQLIIKDVRKGLRNVAELVNKIDLRTPQVLLETQIVEANRSLSRELGAELGFQFLQSPATGNGTGLNFPASIGITGSATPGSANVTGSAFPVASKDIGGSAVTFLFDSADATKTLELRLSQLEQEGRVRIISRPAVATTNNKAAQIKSVERYRVRLPNGGLSVATGSGASANGSGSSATEVIEAGITLDVTPQASPDYFVLLDIRAKSSSFGAKEVEGIPNEIERSASSTVLVSSGQTFALGGIYKITDQDRLTGVPFFKDIPFFGHFFRRSITDNADEELLFFITPRIVEGSFDDASMRSNS